MVATEDPPGVCPDDNALSAMLQGLLPADAVRRLEVHFDTCARCSTLAVELALLQTPTDSSAALLAGRYQLIDTVGAGAMGVVYAALDTKLNRKVAIKRLHEGSVAVDSSRRAERRERFLREAQVVAALSHPNILLLFDAGNADEELFLVMELVDGRPLPRWIAEEKPTWRQILDVYAQAARGVVAAHEAGVVHRDIKPDNILVARNGRVLVTDFGLAALIDERNQSVTATGGADEIGAGGLTRTGQVLGTPAYMAPEQHGGNPGDERSDQFAFCVSLYESLHGRRPYLGATAADLAAAVRADHLPVAGRDGVPRAVDRTLAVGLRAHPAQRYLSMRDLARALARARTSPNRLRLAVSLLTGAAVLIAVPLARHHAPIQGPRLVDRVSDARPTMPNGVALSPTAALPPAVATTLPVAESAEKPRSRRKAPKVNADPRPSDVETKPPTPPSDWYRVASRAVERFQHRDGKGCLSALDEADRLIPAKAASLASTRAYCEMLAGHCEQGKRRFEAWAKTSGRVPPSTLPVAVASSVAQFCQGGARTPEGAE